MPNNVHNAIEIPIPQEREAELMAKIAEFAPGGHIDFARLIPRPCHIYRGNLSGEDERDFGPYTWHAWNRANWGTKWNAYDSSMACDSGVVTLRFETAWSVPYPIIIAIANTLNTPFTHRYLCETAEWWGIEQWGEKKFSEGVTSRIGKQCDDPDDWRSLVREFWGEDLLSELDGEGYVPPQAREVLR